MPDGAREATHLVVELCEAGDERLPTFRFCRGRVGVSPSVLVPPTRNGPWHFLGSPLALCTVHVGGGVGLYLTSRTLIRLTDPAQTPDCTLRHSGRAWRPQAPERVEFRCGEAFWEYVDAHAEQPPLQVRRTIARLDARTFIVDLTFDGIPAGALFEETWHIAPEAIVPVPLMGWKGLPRGSEAITVALLRHGVVLAARTVRTLGTWLRAVVSRSLHYDTTASDCEVLLTPRAALRSRGRCRRDRNRPAMIDTTLPKLSFALAARSENLQASWHHTGGTNTRVRLRARIVPNSYGSTQAHVRYIVRIGSDHNEPTTGQQSGPPLRQTDLPSPLLPGETSLRLELLWHLACLRQLAVYDDYLERTFVTQGSAYLFLHGVHGAPRDYAVAAVALLPFDPDLARSTIESMMLLTQPDGAMYYLHAGRGWCSGALVHESPSDLPIFLMWAVSEYVEHSGDERFLDQRLPFYPKHAGWASTVQDRLELAYRWLKQRLGTGAHGLLRVGSGDWMDPLALMVRRSKRFHAVGESGLNTAFAVHALRRAAHLLKRRRPCTAHAMVTFADELAHAMHAQWTGQWFLRGWDGSDHPIGHDHLFADVQAFCLIAGIGTEEERKGLAEEVYQRCILPSPIGACILDRPHWSRLGLLPPGWDCNGGVWAAINAFLCWGLAQCRPDLARDLFERMRFSARAAAYPNIWYGLWSGPDCFNAHYARRPGETFHLPATPMDEFPVMNSNFHAAPLLAWRKLRDCAA
ncbi:MAG: hypothetical protein N3C12_09855 [Candidatus Binatia bacterium]|nr:hypothetical protein [Candidatus Binatia bacterium]